MTTSTQSLSERLRYEARIGNAAAALCSEAADALDQKDAELEKWQKLAGQGVAMEVRLRTEIMRKDALLEQAAAALEPFSRCYHGHVLNRRAAGEALAAIREVKP